jgi:ribonuclease-3
MTPSATPTETPLRPVEFYVLLGLVEGDLHGYGIIQRTEQQSGGEEKDSVLANGFEAVVGALYLDAGIEPVFGLADELFGPSLEDEAVLARDSKTAFQEWAHAELGTTPRYVLVEDTQTDGADDRFIVAVEANGDHWGQGTGRSKRAAEQAAAASALERGRRQA